MEPARIFQPCDEFSYTAFSEGVITASKSPDDPAGRKW
jgi:hypothetical protein